MYDVLNIDTPAAVKDLLKADFGAEAAPLHPNALPVLVAHGWDPARIFLDTQVCPDPMAGCDERVERMIRDVVAETNGVYRPVFLAYNARARVAANADALAHLLGGRFGEGGTIRGQPFDPNDPTHGVFKGVDALGFSMGGLILRDLQRTFPRIDHLVTIGTPHHGGGDNFLNPLNLLLYTALRTTSPGTADLFSYLEVPRIPNFWLAGLNANPRSAPRLGASFLAGDQHGLEGLVLAPLPNDGVVRVGSARALRGLPFRGQRVRALAKTPVHERILPFRHLTVGRPEAPIVNFIDDVVGQFSDHVVETIRDDPDDPNDFIFTDDELRVTLDVEYHVPHGQIDALQLVVYGLGSDGEWRVVDGADPESLEPTDPRAIEANSRRLERDDKAMKLDLDLPQDLEGAPGVTFTTFTFALARLGPGRETVPPEPTFNFGLPTGSPP